MFRKACPLLAMTAAIFLGSCGSGTSADPDKATSYLATMPVEPAAGGRLQYLALPAEALIALQRDDLADIRVFDGRGKALPLVRIDENTRTDATRSSSPVPSFPIIGPVGSLKLSGVTLRIDDGDKARVVGLDGRIDPGGSDASGVAGTLLDTRKVRDPAVAIELEAELPAGQPVTFTLERSADLKAWQPLAERVFFRSQDSAQVLGGSAIALPSVNLEGQYVRVSWSAASPLVSPVSIHAARVATSRLAPRQRVAVNTSPAGLADAHEVRFATAFATPIAALRLSDADGDGVIPVKAYGRKDLENPWTLLGAGVVRQGEALIEFRSSGFTHYRIEADKRTGGFEHAPSLQLLFDPVAVAVQFNDTAPYTLAAGLAAAPDTYLTAQEILPDGQELDPASLPRAKARSDAARPPVVSLTASGDERLAPRNILLWLALVLAVVVLALAVFRLSRPATQPGSD